MQGMMIVTLLVLGAPLVWAGNLQQTHTIDSLKAEISRDSTDYMLYYQLGCSYSSTSQGLEALDAFNRCLLLKPDFTLVKYKVAILYYEMDSLKRAQLEFEELQRLTPSNECVYAWLGLIYGRWGWIEHMREAHTKYMAGKKEGAITDEFWWKYIILYISLGQHREAIEAYQKAVTYYEDPFELEGDLAMICQSVGDTVNAKKWFKKSLQHYVQYCRYVGVKPSKSFHWYRAWLCYRLGRFDDAIAIMDSIVDSGESSEFADFRLGVYKLAAGDTGGLSHIRQAITIDTTGLAKAFYCALLATKSDSFAVAVDYLQQDIEGLKYMGIARGLLAWSTEKLGQDYLARKYWFNCYGLLPLGLDAASMQDFMDRFVKTVRSE